MTLTKEIAQLHSEITALESAIEAVKAEQIRPSDPIGDSVFGILKANLASIEHDRESREFEREKARRIDVFEQSLAEMRSRLVAFQEQAEREAIEESQKQIEIEKCFERLDSSLQTVKAEFKILQQHGYKIPREVEENFPTLFEKRLLPRFQVSWYSQPKINCDPKPVDPEIAENRRRSIAAAALGKKVGDPTIGTTDYTQGATVDRLLRGY